MPPIIISQQIIDINIHYELHHSKCYEYVHYCRIPLKIPHNQKYELHHCINVID